jgi:hypothetical protein
MTEQQLQLIKRVIGVARHECTISRSEAHELCTVLDELYNHAQFERRAADVATVNAWAAVESHELFTARYERVLEWCKGTADALSAAANAIRRGEEP